MTGPRPIEKSLIGTPAKAPQTACPASCANVAITRLTKERAIGSRISFIGGIVAGVERRAV